MNEDLSGFIYNITRKRDNIINSYSSVTNILHRANVISLGKDTNQIEKNVEAEELTL